MSAPPDDADVYAVMRAIDAVVARAREGEDVGDVPWIVELLDRGDRWERASAADAIGPLGLRDAMPGLVRLLAEGPEPTPEHIASEGHAYALVVDALESVDVRLGAARSLGRLLRPGDDEAREALRAAAENEAEHASVRAAARAALLGDGTGRELANAKARAVELALRMDARAGLITEARDFPDRISEADRERALLALREKNRDGTELAGLVRWALDRHRAAMLAWADEAAALDLSDAYREGWECTHAWWVASPARPAVDPPPALSWLLAMWQRATGS